MRHLRQAGSPLRSDKLQGILAKANKLKVNMETRPEIPQVLFDAMLDEALEDLCRSGLDREEIIGIIEEQFGLSYARRFRDKASFE